MVVLVAERLERESVSIGVGAYLEVFGMTEGGSKGMEGGIEPWISWRPTPGELSK